MSVDVLDADGTRRTLSTIGELLTYLQGGTLGVVPADILRDSTAAAMPNPDTYAQVLAYNGDGTLATVAFTDGSHTWTQTYTYTAGLVTGVSRWVRT